MTEGQKMAAERLAAAKDEMNEALFAAFQAGIELRVRSDTVGVQQIGPAAISRWLI